MKGLFKSLNSSKDIILRLSLSATFIVIGIMIVNDPLAWSSFIKPWAQSLLVGPIKTTMLATGLLDILIGLMLISKKTAFWGGLLGSMHLVSVLVVSGVDLVTVRDIGLLGATLFVTIQNTERNKS